MNAARRKEISRAQQMIEEAKAILESCESEERDYYDNMPESFQQGEKGTKAEEAADALQEAINSCDEVVSHIDTATGA